MMKWMLAAGAAALAISAPIAAERGGGKGQQGQAAQVQQGDRGGKARAQRGGGSREFRAQRGGGNREVRAQRGGGSGEFRAQRGGGIREVRVERRGGGNREMRAARVDRGGERGRARTFGVMQSDNRGRRGGRDEVRVGTRGQDRARSVRIDNDRGRGRDNVKFEARGNDQARGVRFDDRSRGRDDSRIVRLGRDDNVIRGRGARVADFKGDRVFRVRDIDRRGEVRFRDVDRDDLFVRRLGYGVGGCPPGLAKKGNGCMPPGQAAKFIGQPLIAATRFGALDALPLSMRSLYWDNDDYYYRYGGGYLYRVDRDRDLIDGVVPLFGAALLGQQLSPYYVNSYYRPPYYSAFYPNSPYDCYQYGYGYVYETDCVSGLVEDVIPTYDYGYGVGQMLPASYGYYNLPYTYRSSFIDDDDYYYRYAPGSIYRVDRDTSLISAVVALLTNGLTVGQPLPMGYSAYNVPLAYRTTYYDTPDAWYRYDNGYIYAVDPGTRVVRNVAYAIV